MGGGGGGQCRHNDEFPKRPFLNSPPIWKYLVFKKKKKKPSPWRMNRLWKLGTFD